MKQRKILAILLSLMMILSSISFVAFADTSAEPTNIANKATITTNGTITYGSTANVVDGTTLMTASNPSRIELSGITNCPQVTVDGISYYALTFTFDFVGNYDVSGYKVYAASNGKYSAFPTIVRAKDSEGNILSSYNPGITDANYASFSSKHEGAWGDTYIHETQEFNAVTTNQIVIEMLYAIGSRDNLRHSEFEIYGVETPASVDGENIASEARVTLTDAIEVSNSYSSLSGLTDGHLPTGANPTRTEISGLSTSLKATLTFSFDKKYAITAYRVIAGSNGKYSAFMNNVVAKDAKGNVLSSYDPGVTDANYESMHWAYEGVYGNAFDHGMKILSSSVETNEFVLEFAYPAGSRDVQRIYEIEIYGTKVVTDFTGMNVAPISSVISNGNVTWGDINNIKDGVNLMTTDNASRIDMSGIQSCPQVIVDGVSYYNLTFTFTFPKNYSVSGYKVYAASNGKYSAFPTIVRAKDSEGNILSSYNPGITDANYADFSSKHEGAWGDNYVHETQEFNAVTTKQVVFEMLYAIGSRDNLRHCEFEIYGVEFVKDFTGMNIATSATVSANTNYNGTENMFITNIIDGNRVSPETDTATETNPRGKRAVIYSTLCPVVTHNSADAYKLLLTFNFDSLKDIEGIKLFTLTDGWRLTPAKATVYDQRGNTLATYNVDESSYTAHSGYGTTYEHPQQEFDAVTTNQIVVELIYPVVGTRNEIWLSEIEIYGKEATQAPTLTNVALSSNDGSVVANVSQESRTSGCVCDVVNGNGLIMSAKYLIDGANGTVEGCEQVMHRYVSPDLDENTNVILNHAFGQKSKIYYVDIKSISTTANGHIAQIDIKNGDTLLKSVQTVDLISGVAPFERIWLNTPVVTDNLTIVLYPTRDDETIAKKLEVIEIGIFAEKSDIQVNGTTITATDISSSQDANLVIATYTDVSKTELLSVEIVALTDGAVTKDMASYANYKVFFWNGLDATDAISYKVIED